MSPDAPSWPQMGNALGAPTSLMSGMASLAGTLIIVSDSSQTTSANKVIGCLKWSAIVWTRLRGDKENPTKETAKATGHSLRGGRILTLQFLEGSEEGAGQSRTACMEAQSARS